MKSAAKPILGNTQTIHLLPRWISHSGGEAPDTVAFTSGAALAMLDVVLRDLIGTLPSALLRDRMTLEAAVACLKLENRNESMSDIRDAVCLARAGDALGPAGDMFEAWRKVARINPIQSGWKDRVMPLLAAYLPRKDIRAIADGTGDPVLCVHRAMIAACNSVIRNAADLSRRAERLRAIAPKLRAKGSDEALDLFLSHDAVSPSGMLSPTIKGTSFAMTDRAARRLCDRLVELGVVRELTGRSTFRLYGV